MKLFWCPQTRSQRALWLMEEAALDYELVLIDVSDASKPRDPDFAKASLMGKVPALADGERGQPGPPVHRRAKRLCRHDHDQGQSHLLQLTATRLPVHPSPVLTLTPTPIQMLFL